MIHRIYIYNVSFMGESLWQSDDDCPIKPPSSYLVRLPRLITYPGIPHLNGWLMLVISCSILKNIFDIYIDNISLDKLYKLCWLTVGYIPFNDLELKKISGIHHFHRAITGPSSFLLVKKSSHLGKL